MTEDKPATAAVSRLQANGLSDLAEKALARLCEKPHVETASEGARQVLGDPLSAAMAYALCDDEDDAATALVDDLLEAGVSIEDVCLDHLAPAARRLGELWETDRLPFTEVTLATARIQAMLRRMPMGRIPISCLSRKGAIFGAVPGEEHTLGVVMAADLFRRNGWDVSLLMGLSHDEMITRFIRDDRQVIGLSCSGDHSYKSLQALVSDLRDQRPTVQILVSGQIAYNAEKIEAIDAPVTVVRDVTEAEAVMQRIGGEFSARSAANSGQPDERHRESSAA